MLEKLKTHFSFLPLYIKCIFIGLAVSLSGLFLNWFSAVDSFDKGVNFNALNGPNWLIGYTLLGLTSYSLLAMLKYLKRSNCEVTQLKKYYVEKWSGFIVMYLSLAVASFYLSSSFLGSYNKSIGLGFFITLTGSLITVSGSILFKTKKCDELIGGLPISENQLDLDLEIPVESAETESPSLPEQSVSSQTNSLVNDIIVEHNPVYRELSKKQKEIEAKLLHK